MHRISVPELYSAFKSAFRTLLLTSLTALSACTPKEATDNWKLSPPMLEMKTTGGIATRLKANEAGKQTSSADFADESSTFYFDTKDQGLSATFKTRCVNAVTVTSEHIQAAITSDRLSVISVLPPEVFSPRLLSQTWTCEFKISVTNQLGSKSGGNIGGIKVDLTRLNSELNTAVESAPSGMSRRLVCPTWWSDATDDSLDTMAKSSQVNGIDTRKRDRQPLCSVIELGQNAKFLGSYRPVFASASISVLNSKILIPAAADMTDFFHRKLFSWVIRNDENYPVIAFIAATNESIRFSTITNTKLLKGRSMRARIFPLFSQSGAIRSRQTSAGFYVALHPNASAEIEMSSNRAPTVRSAVGFQENTHLVMDAISPIFVTALSGDLDPNLLFAMDGGVLDSQPRDNVRPSATPLLNSLLILEPNGNGFLKPSNMTPAELAKQPKDIIEIEIEYP